MDAPSNSSSSSSSHSSTAIPPADGQDDRAAVRPAQGSPALPPTKEPPLWDPSSSPSPSPDDVVMRPCASAQASALSLAKFPTAISSTSQLQEDPSSSLPNPPLFPLDLPLAEDGVQPQDHRDEDGGREAQLFFAPDGSAYLLASGHVLLPKGSPVTATPQVSILHIQDSGGPNQGFMSADQMSQNTSAPGEVIPQGAFYSYRLAGAPAQSTSAKNAATKSKDDPTSPVENEEAPRGRDKTMPGGPLWLCLTCRLSFNQGRTLASHARTVHDVQLSNEEHQDLDGGASAVLQGTDLGFLEPNNPTTKADLNARMCSRWVNVKEEEEEEEEENEKSPERRCEPSDTKDSRVGGTHWAIRSMEEERKEKKEKEEEEEKEVAAQLDERKKEKELLPDQSSPATSSAPLAANTAPSETPLSEAPNSDHTGPPQEDVNKDMTNDKLPKEGPIHKVPRVDLADEISRAESVPKANSVPSDTNRTCIGLARDISPTDLSDSLSSVGMANEVATVGFEVNNGLGNNGHNGGGGPSLSFGEDFTAMAYSGLTLSGHMSLLHSRNSCKTLKCPKCNWHYKYQQTLDVHMKEKHPENNSHCAYCSTGGPHPRLARGESYNCGYKPYRCEACNYSTTTKGNLSIHMQSDKHLANLQGYQATGGSGSPVAPPVAPSPSSPEEKESKGKSSWQCKVCSYETNISRNLRIHMTSEKHMQNMLLLHQGLPLTLPGLLGQPQTPPGGKAQPELFPFYGAQALGHAHHSHPHQAHAGSNPPLRADKPMEQPPLLLNGGFQHLSAAGRKMATLGAAPTSLSPEPAPPSSPPAQSGPDPLVPQRLFSCLVCQVFSTDSLDTLLRHASAPRSLPEVEWKEISGDLHRCRLCAYGTQLKANFQLHLKTDKHALKYQLAAHLREGGSLSAHLGVELPLGPPLHLHCNLCEYETNSKEKIQLHAAGSGHQEALQGYKFLLEMETTSSPPPASEPTQFRCLLCNTDAPSRLAMIQHLRSPQHREAHGQWRLQLLQNGKGTLGLERYVCFVPANAAGKESVLDSLTPEREKQNKTWIADSEETEAAASGSAGDTTVFCCPYCNYADQSAEAVRAHTVSQHAVQPKFHCPLCQEQLVGRANLHFHLSHVHNVVAECVEKLLLVATTVEMTFATRVIPGVSLPPDPPKPGGTLGIEQEAGPEAPGPFIAPAAEEKASPTPVLSPETPPPCVAASPPPKEQPEKSLPASPPPPPPPPPAVTPQEPEEDDPLHPNMTPEEQPPPAPLLADPPEASPPILPNLDSRHPLSYRKATNFALDKFLDPARPYKCTVCKESFTQKNILLVHYNSVSHLHKMKKASADPSVSSRGEPGAPGALQPSSDKPYKCTTCRVSYNQSSTLEIHMRSVLHQTRSRVAKMEAAGKADVSPAELEPPNDTPLETEAPSCVQVPALPFLTPPAAELPRFPTPLFTPPLLPPFPLVPESLLKLQQQQQQLLLPFYLHDLKVAPKLALATPTLTLPTPSPVLLPPLPPKEEPAPTAGSSSKVEAAEETEGEEVDGSQAGNEASRTAAKALLENFGFELVIQYNEGKQTTTVPPTVPLRPPMGKLQCGTCGKQFSNMLILKTHEEHVHRRFLPFEALNRYAVQFRKSYDSMYPPPPPVLPVETTAITTTAAAAAAAVSTVTTTVLENTTVTVTQSSLPLEIPSLCPPFLMQPLPVVMPPPESETPCVPPECLKSLWFRGEEEEGKSASSGVLELPRGSFPATRRFSRTKFTEFQSQALQSFFESSAYPKDGEVERLSALLGLPNRVIVVWFQNARQKARKSSGNEVSMGNCGNTAVQPSCKKCRTAFRCIFELMRHLKKCYNNELDEGEEDGGEEENEGPEEEEEEEDEKREILDPSGDMKTDGIGDKPVEEEQPVHSVPPDISKNYPCDQCTAVFSSSDLLNIHRISHLPAAGPPLASTGPQPPLDTTPLVFGDRPVNPDPSRAQKRKHEDGTLSPTGSETASVVGGDNEPPRDKRLRTTILPEQLEILYRWYMQDSNPTRKMLDCISEEVGLKKRVVQVWFQNTRARERKGQFRCNTSVTTPTSKPPPAQPNTFPKFNPPPRDTPVHYGGSFTPNLPVVNLQPLLTKPELVMEPQSLEEMAEEVPKEHEDRSLSGGELSDSSSSSSSADLDFSGGHRTRTMDGGSGEFHDSFGQRRYRTQMSSLQLKIMKVCYGIYRTPTMQECEVLGEEIGLPKRVIQVWFQNARAKEKKAKAASGGTSGGDEAPSAVQAPSECPYCEVKYDFYVSCRGHLFSRGHLARLKEAIKSQLKSESKCYELVSDKGAPSPTRLGVPVTPTAVPSSLGTKPPFVPGTPASPAGILSTPLTSSQPGLSLPQHLPPESGQVGPLTEPVPAPETSPSDSQAELTSNSVQEPSLSSAVTLKNLKTLKAAVPALLGGQFLPFPLPAAATAAAAAPSLFGAQLPGAYFQQLYGMKKGLFPMNPVIPQTLMGLLPSPLLPTPTPEPPVEVSEAPGISTVDVTHQYLCRQCKAAFESEGAAVAHQAALCYFGRQSSAAPPPLRVPVCTYHCLACEVLVSGREALGAHLRSSAHRRKASSTTATASVFAKEESKLPHSDSNPKSNSTSTTLLAL